MKKDIITARVIVFLSFAVSLYGIIDVREWQWIVFPLVILAVGVYIGWFL